MNIIIFLAVFLVNLSTGFADIRQRRVLGDYEVTIVWNNDFECEQVVFKKDGIVVHVEKEWGSYYWIGNEYGAKKSGWDPYSGKDITSDGSPNIIVTQWNGGAHCCYFLSVFSLEKSGPRKLIKIDGGSSGFDLKDLDHDGREEIIFWDSPIDYTFTSFADSAQGKTVLKYINGRYRVASSLMYRRRPTDSELSDSKIRIRKKMIETSAVPKELLTLMMNLHYTGYKELGTKMAKEIWPWDQDSFRKFKRQFSESLSHSAYWREFDRGEY